MSAVLRVLTDVQLNMAKADQLQRLVERMDAHEAEAKQFRSDHETLAGRVTRLETRGSDAGSLASSSAAEVDPTKLELRGYVRDTQRDKVQQLAEAAIGTLPASPLAPHGWRHLVKRIVMPYTTGSIAMLQFENKEFAQLFLDVWRERHGGYGCFWDAGGGHHLYAGTQRTEKQKRRSRVLYRFKDALSEVVRDEGALSIAMMKGHILYKHGDEELKLAVWRRRTETLDFRDNALTTIGIIMHLGSLREEALDAE